MKSGKLEESVKLFLPHKTLEDWMVAEKADLQDGKLFVAENKTTYPVAAAVHFAKLVSGEDGQGLLGRVKTTAQLTALNAEHFQDSCIVGEAAYEVVEGYITEVQTAPAAKGDAKKKTGSPEADLLAAFILDKL